MSKAHNDVLFRAHYNQLPYYKLVIHPDLATRGAGTQINTPQSAAACRQHGAVQTAEAWCSARKHNSNRTAEAWCSAHHKQQLQ
jgi:hypothetical protein